MALRMSSNCLPSLYIARVLRDPRIGLTSRVMSVQLENPRERKDHHVVPATLPLASKTSVHRHERPRSRADSPWLTQPSACQASHPERNHGQQQWEDTEERINRPRKVDIGQAAAAAAARSSDGPRTCKERDDESISTVHDDNAASAGGGEANVSRRRSGSADEEGAFSHPCQEHDNRASEWPSSHHEKPAGAGAGTAHRLRPAFTTLQQHYSPAKSSAPKPLTSTFLAPPSPSKRPANVAASAETSRLQTELLQLHLLHRDATGVDAAWRASAERKLGQRFSRLAGASEKVDGRERAEIERGNVMALRKWAIGGGLEERIQTLDAVINGVWTLGESGGRYVRVVRRFERWVDRMCEIEEARREGGALLQESDVIFIGELDAAWKDECAGLVRRLDTLGRQLDELGRFSDEADDGDDSAKEERSSLQRMVEGSRTLIQGMLAELNIMDEIERDALAREDEWIERMNRDEAADEAPRAGAIWRVV
ncbi:hypothetical protein ACJ41O_004214 [Fusarium nematophilum]